MYGQLYCVNHTAYGKWYNTWEFIKTPTHWCTDSGVQCPDLLLKLNSKQRACKFDKARLYHYQTIWSSRCHRTSCLDVGCHRLLCRSALKMNADYRVYFLLALGTPCRCWFVTMVRSTETSTSCPAEPRAKGLIITCRVEVSWLKFKKRGSRVWHGALDNHNNNRP